MSIHELEQERQKRLQQVKSVFDAPDDSSNSRDVKQTYQRELARCLKRNGNLVVTPSTDQQIAGMLKSAGFPSSEIEVAIELCSPVAIKPSSDQSRAYAKSVVQRARLPKKNNRQLLSFDSLSSTEEVETNVVPEALFECVSIDVAHIVYKYRGRLIVLPTDTVYENEDSVASLYVVSQAMYQDSNEIINEADASALERYLLKRAAEEGLVIEVE